MLKPVSDRNLSRNFLKELTRVTVRKLHFSLAVRGKDATISDTLQQSHINLNIHNTDTASAGAEVFNPPYMRDKEVVRLTRRICLPPELSRSFIHSWWNLIRRDSKTVNSPSATNPGSMINPHNISKTNVPIMSDIYIRNFSSGRLTNPANPITINTKRHPNRISSPCSLRARQRVENVKFSGA